MKTEYDSCRFTNLEHAWEVATYGEYVLGWIKWDGLDHEYYFVPSVIMYPIDGSHLLWHSTLRDVVKFMGKLEAKEYDLHYPGA